MINVYKAVLTRDKRTILSMNPWIRLQIGELHQDDSRVVSGGGKTPDFQMQQFIFDLTLHDPKMIQIKCYDLKKRFFCCENEYNDGEEDLVAEAVWDLNQLSNF